MVVEVVSVTDRRAEEHNRELWKLSFEYHKHFTTIATASAVVDLVLYRELGLSSDAALIGIYTLGFTLALAIVGMWVVPTRASAAGRFPSFGHRQAWVMALTAVSYFGGILMFAFAAVGPFA